MVDWKKVGIAIAGILIGIFGGLTAYVILDYYFKKKERALWHMKNQ